MRFNPEAGTLLYYESRDCLPEMSRYDPYNLEATFMRDDQSRHAPAPLQNIPTYSLAGNNTREHVPSRLRTNSYVTAEYEQLNPNYNLPENTPIWGLARPLPRVVRPGMRPRKPLAATDQHVLRNGNTSAITHPAQPVPQVQVTPQSPKPATQSDFQPDLFPAHTWTPGQQFGALTNRASSLHHRSTVSTSGPNQSQRPQPIQEEEQANQPTTRQDSARVNRSSQTLRTSQEAADPLRTTPTHRPSTHDFAIEPDEQPADGNSALARYKSSLSGDRFAIEDGRRRLQEHADDAAQEPSLQYPAPMVDWDELNPLENRLKRSISNRYPDPAQEEVTAEVERHYHNSWAKFRHRMRMPLAEFLGTFVTMVFGLSASMVHIIAQNQYGNFFTSNLGFGLGVMIGIYSCGGISGAHLNPAISIMLSVFRGFPWHHCYRYIIAQFLGAFAAAGVVYGLFRDAIMHVNGGLIRSSTGVAFYTQPQDWISNTTAFFTEFVATAILSGIVLALGDDSNAPPGAGMHAFIIGLLVTALSMSFSYNTGAALNPARDFGPRLVTLAAGYGSEVFTVRSCWWLRGAWVAPVTGSLFGAFVYDGLIFTGGESPVNYPGGQLRMRVDAIKEKATRLSSPWEKNADSTPGNDGEKMEEADNVRGLSV